METHHTIVCWKGEQFWLGKLMEHPEIMTQGETIEELKENVQDAYRMMMLADLPDLHLGEDCEC
jgi:predicted RNase H-like HicB family nuclease